MRPKRFEGLGPTGRRIEAVRPKTEFQIIKKCRAKFDGLMSNLAEQANQDFLDRGAEKILRPDGRIDMEAFNYDLAKINHDKNEVDRIEIELYGLDDPHSQKYKDAVRDFKAAHEDRDPVDVFELLDFCNEIKADSLGNLCEMVISVVLHRNFGEECLVARSSRIDDLLKGVDGYIYHKKSNARICSIDGYVVNDNSEITYNEKPQKFERLNKKMTRQGEIMEKGGASLEYGFEIIGGEVLPKKIDNIPIFIAAINRQELLDLAQTMSADINGPISAKEKTVFNKLIESLKKQADSALKKCKDKKLKSNIEAFMNVLEGYTPSVQAA